jgi:hypothetical protein
VLTTIVGLLENIKGNMKGLTSLGQALVRDAVMKRLKEAGLKRLSEIRQDSIALEMLPLRRRPLRTLDEAVVVGMASSSATR